MWTRLAVVAIVCATMSARSQAAPAAPDSSAEATWLEVSVNGQKAEQVALFLREPDGRLLAPATQWVNWRLRPTTQEPVAYQGEQYIPLDAMPGLSYHVDDARQIVTIDAQASLFDQV